MSDKMIRAAIIVTTCLSLATFLLLVYVIFE
jgi:phage shock protein PspC (stress-responsive transcriptional regulator)